jgi:hypothetical protein
VKAQLEDSIEIFLIPLIMKLQICKACFIWCRAI